MQYDMTFVRYGFVTIDADSEAKAFEIAEGYGAEDICWSDDFRASDAQESER